jgi:hypothetical protein
MRDKYLTLWVIKKLRRWDKVKPKALPPHIPADDEVIMQIYQEYEERKRINRIKLSLLLGDDFPVTNYAKEYNKTIKNEKVH